MSLACAQIEFLEKFKVQFVVLMLDDQQRKNIAFNHKRKVSAEKSPYDVKWSLVLLLV